MINNAISRKIRTISLLAIFSVVAWHSDCGSSIERWFIPWFTTWSVPWFFVVSGFFFAKTVEKYSVSMILCRKVETTLLPYLFWCLVGWCMWRPSYCAVREIWGLSSSIFPCGNWPLWYVRALIIFMVVELLVCSLCRVRCNKGVMVVLSAILIVCARLVMNRLEVGICPISSIIYFTIGGLCSALLDTRCLSNVALPLRVRSRLVVLTFSLCGIFAIRTFCSSHIAINGAILLSLVAIWFVLDFFDLGFIKSEFIELTAGIYFIHGPLIKTFDKYVSLYMSRTLGPLQIDLYYCARIIGFFVFSAVLCYAIKRFLPRFAKFALGGR